MDEKAEQGGCELAAERINRIAGKLEKLGDDLMAKGPGIDLEGLDRVASYWKQAAAVSLELLNVTMQAMAADVAADGTPAYAYAVCRADEDNPTACETCPVREACMDHKGDAEPEPIAP